MVFPAGVEKQPQGRTATIIVSASDSRYWWTCTPGYHCDGTADDVQVNAAFAALGTDGGRVILLDGTYTIADSIVIPDSAITLEGQGRSTFVDGDGLATTEHAIIATGRTNIVIKNLAIQTADGGGNTIHCIFLDDGCNYTQIENVIIVDSDYDGIHIAGTNVTDIKIINCIIEDADDHGIYVDMDAANTSSGVLITGCRIIGTGDDGIYFGATGAGHTYARITDNLISSCGDCGIDVHEMTYSLISDNISYTNSDSGILLSSGSNYNNLMNNQCYNNTNYGIVISATCSRTRVFDNTLQGNTTGQISEGGTDTILPEIILGAPNPDSNIGEHAAQQMLDGVLTDVRMELFCPSTFQELVRAQVVVVAVASGNLYWSSVSHFAKICNSEDYDTHSDAIGVTATAVTLKDLECIDIAAVLSGIAASDWVGIKFTRLANSASDTVNDRVYLLGMRMQYV